MSDAEDFFEHAAVGMRLVAADGTILRANQAELDLLGYRRDEYVGHNLADFDADDDNLCALLARVRAGESVDKRPARLIGGDGRVRQVQISSSGRFERGQFVHSRCITIDVKDQNSRQRATAECGRLSQQLLQALPIAVHGTDAGGAITFFNEAAVELAGGARCRARNGVCLRDCSRPMARRCRTSSARWRGRCAKRGRFMATSPWHNGPMAGGSRSPPIPRRCSTGAC